MNTDPGRSPISNPRAIGVYLCSSVLLLCSSGCLAKPNQANIALRKQIQALEAQVAELQRRHEADVATIRSLEAQRGTLPTLPADRLQQLFTTSGIKLGRLTGGADLDPSSPGDEGIKVYVVPIDQTGDELKAAGAFDVQLFDLNKPHDNLVGQWHFSVEQAREHWYGSALQYGYVLPCRWQGRVPEHGELTLKVSFHDALTQRQFSIQKVITVNPPPGTQPTTQADVR
ncbi:hypothetical protein [Fontivita pretiosa]|uniref:hypothetical protein n=1 Tax=Fontivita pretiosa TaxID=2989684 RepID=UPI003D1732BC